MPNLNSTEKMELIIHDLDNLIKDEFDGWGIFEYSHYMDTIYTTIEGDWKHAHARYDMRLNQLLAKYNCGIRSETETEIGESDSDWYKSEHIVIVDLYTFELPPET